MEDVDERREKRDWSSLSCEALLADGWLAAGLREGEDSAGGGSGDFALFPMPKPGTDTPAAPNLFKEP